MNCKRWWGISAVLLFAQLLIAASVVFAEEKVPEIALLYMTDDGKPNSNIFFIEATLAGFTNQIDLYSAEGPEKEIGLYDVVVFVGDYKGDVPEWVRHAINNFQGRLLAFGYNAEQLTPFQDWHIAGEEYIRNLDGNPLRAVKSVLQAIPPADATVLSEGETSEKKLPFISNKGKVSYIATTSFGTEEKYVLSRSLYELLDRTEPDSHPAYIRLEDISPISDAKLVEETGMYLADRGIPFFMAIIPVYVNSETGEQISLARNKPLVEVLKRLQDRGGMVIAHGYTHSYRSDETGEGFEFWDVELNQPITTERMDELPPKLKTVDSFTSAEQYETYKQMMNQVEIRYIERKHKKSIETLTALGLYPVAFEAPHYTMSSNGYKITSGYFSSIFGQIQLSDSNWSVMDSPLFIGKPAILAGMTLYPETIGYVDPGLANPLHDMGIAVKRLQTVPGSVIGGFYHPYLGLSYLPELIELMESIPNMEWIDFQQENYFVRTDRVAITQTGTGGRHIESSLTAKDQLLDRMYENPFDLALWIVAVIVLVFLAMFAVYVTNLRIRLKKRLFEEREFIG
ncbi:DUF2334 domain-containing protein [Sporosarcina sp. FSL W7-1349]|uniref:DUF2334 domain-containing protein n=1 Tax=Sporosarcina sp. FSL W7-1349 TaxID=2921561 RepID=UPI0030F89410